MAVTSYSFQSAMYDSGYIVGLNQNERGLSLTSDHPHAHQFDVYCEFNELSGRLVVKLDVAGVVFPPGSGSTSLGISPDGFVASFQGGSNAQTTFYAEIIPAGVSGDGGREEVYLYSMLGGTKRYLLHDEHIYRASEELIDGVTRFAWFWPDLPDEDWAPYADLLRKLRRANRGSDV